jgi:hypothetical protein
MSNPPTKPLAANLPQDIPLNNRKALNEMLVEMGFPVKLKDQKPRGFWLPYAWAVRVMVETMGGGRIVAHCVRLVLRRAGLSVTKDNIEALRIRYIAIKNKPWPDGMEAYIAKRRGRPPLPKEGLFGEKPPEPPKPEPVVTAAPEPEPEEPSLEGEDFIDPELRAELERELSEGYIPDPE